MAGPSSYPALYYNVNSPPLVIVNNIHGLKLDGSWVPIDLTPADPTPPAYPKLYGNVNLPPIWIQSAAHANLVTGPAWKWLDLSQWATASKVTLSPTSASIAAAGGSGSFNVTLVSGGTWIVGVDGVNWIHITSPTGSQSANGPVNYTVDKRTGPPRTGNIWVNTAIFTITQ